MKRITLALLALCMAQPAFAQSTVGIYRSTPPVLTDGVQQQVLLDANGNLRVSPVVSAPSVNVRGASGSVANAAATATLTGTATTTVYITGFTCTPGGATAAALVSVTVTGTLGGTMTYTVGAPAGAAVAGYPLVVTFSPAYPAAAINTAIAVSMPALGAGNTNAACVATGFYQ